MPTERERAGGRQMEAGAFDTVYYLDMTLNGSMLHVCRLDVWASLLMQFALCGPAGPCAVSAGFGAHAMQTAIKKLALKGSI